MTASIEDVQSLWPEPFADAHATGAICLYRSLADTNGLQAAVPNCSRIWMQRVAFSIKSVHMMVCLPGRSPNRKHSEELFQEDTAHLARSAV